MRNELIDLIDDAMHDWDDVVSECQENGELPPDSFEEHIADYLLANGVTIQRWIPVEERLPEEQGYYIVVHGKSKNICVRFFYKECPEAFAYVTNDPVTHWMPLPKPPKEDEK